jgi:hypothetical protein
MVLYTIQLFFISKYLYMNGVPLISRGLSGVSNINCSGDISSKTIEQCDGNFFTGVTSNLQAQINASINQARGIQGNVGPQGNSITGAQGIQGVQGNSITGAQGIQGVQGNSIRVNLSMITKTYPSSGNGPTKSMLRHSIGVYVDVVKP